MSPSTPSFVKKRAFSKSQAEQLVLDTDSPEPTHVNTIGAIFWLDGRFSDAVIERAVRHIIEQEQALRLRMGYDAEQFFQYEFPYEPKPLRGLGVIMQEDELIGHFAQEMASFSFSLDAPLYDFCLARTDVRAGLRAFFHHIIIDGVSIGVFGSMLTQYCELLQNGQELPRVAHNFLETVECERKHATDEAIEAAKNFWRESFVAQPPEFCRVSPKSVKKTILERGNRITRTLPTQTGRLINAYCEREDISPASLFQAALVLYLWDKNPDVRRISYGAMVSNRVGLLQKSMLGNFALELLHSVPVLQNGSIRELYQSIKKASIEAFRHAACSYEDTVLIAAEQDATVESLRDVQFIYLPPVLPHGRAFYLHWLPNYSPETNLEFAVFNMTDCDEFTLVFDYRPDAFSADEAETALDELAALAEFCIHNPSADIDDALRFLPTRQMSEISPILKSLRRILSKYTSAPVILESSRIGSDLRLDSFDVVNLVSEVEELFQITLKDEDFQQWVTVQDIITFINEKKDAK